MEEEQLAASTSSISTPEKPAERERPASPAGPSFMSRVKRGARILWLIIQYGFDRLADATGDNLIVIRREANLFVGLAFSIVGLMNFRNGKNCDGNTVEYLSCTRPSTFYYYTALEMILVTVGVSLIIVWVLKRFPHKQK